MSFAKKIWKNKGEEDYENSKINNNSLNDLENRIDNGFKNIFAFNNLYYSNETIDFDNLNSNGIYTIDINCTFKNGPSVSSRPLCYVIVLSVSTNAIQIFFEGDKALHFRLKEWGIWKKQWYTIFKREN